MTDTGDDLLATSEAIAADAERLREIEVRKQELPEDHPDVLPLSLEAAALVRGLVPKAAAELELAAEAAEEVGTAKASGPEPA